MTEVRRAIKGNRIATARSRLKELEAGRGASGEVLLLLGECELTLGHEAAALDCFRRVPPDDANGGLAATYVVRLLLNDGRLAEAEEFAGRLPESDESRHAAEARVLHDRLLKLEGRSEEATDHYRRWFDRQGDPVEALRALWTDRVGHADSRYRAYLETGHSMYPEDDRLWLGLARLELTEGDLETADEWLKRCEARRASDSAVARARLEWSIKANDAASAAAALDRLSPETVSRGRLLELAGWFARARGDADREREALTLALAEPDTNRPELLERLAELARERGDRVEHSRLRREKGRVDRARLSYGKLIYESDPARAAATLAEQADLLGMAFEASCWRRVGVGASRAAATLVDVRTAEASRASYTLDDLRSEIRRGAVVGPKSSQGPAKDRLLIPTFRDQAQVVGLEFTYEPGSLEAGRSIAEMMGGGIGLIDYDEDGWLDVYLVQGGRFPPVSGEPNGDRLFRNVRGTRFEDVTERSGIAGLAGGYGHGVAVGDFDGDGRADLLVTRWRSCQLLRNRGDGTFEDVTDPAGLAGVFDWPTSAAWADLDGDGDLDLYVCQYVDFDPEEAGGPAVFQAGSPNDGTPLTYRSLTDRLLRNDGGRFSDITVESGLAAIDGHGRGLGVVAADLDEDGAIDLFVANDMTANFLLRHVGDLKFEDVGELAGLAGGASGGYLASMGIAFGDLDGDHRPDLAVTNFLGEGMSLHRNLGGGLFADRTALVGLLDPTRSMLGFGAAFLDANNDGWLDLAATNGHVNDVRPLHPFAMPSQLFLGTAGSGFVDVSTRAGPEWLAPRVGRALAVGDLDNDGRVDVLIGAQDGPLAYLRNETADVGRFLVLRLEASTTARSAEGSRVVVEAGGRRIAGFRFGGGSYQSASDPRLHFGLGGASRVDLIEVRWPSGRVERFRDLAVDSAWVVREGSARPEPLPGYARPAE